MRPRGPAAPPSPGRVSRRAAPGGAAPRSCGDAARGSPFFRPFRCGATSASGDQAARRRRRGDESARGGEHWKRGAVRAPCGGRERGARGAAPACAPGVPACAAPARARAAVGLRRRARGPGGGARARARAAAAAARGARRRRRARRPHRGGETTMGGLNGLTGPRAKSSGQSGGQMDTPTLSPSSTAGCARRAARTARRPSRPHVRGRRPGRMGSRAGRAKRWHPRRVALEDDAVCRWRACAPAAAAELFVCVRAGSTATRRARMTAAVALVVEEPRWRIRRCCA